MVSRSKESRCNLEKKITKMTMPEPIAQIEDQTNTPATEGTKEFIHHSC